jgi:hypothetical protein
MHDGRLLTLEDTVEFFDLVLETKLSFRANILSRHTAQRLPRGYLLPYPASRWRRTLRRLPIRYRKPYTARHTSVSWNLMIGKNPLQVAKQHGHSVSTMFRVYSAWMQGAVESDIDAVKRAMRLDSVPTQANTKLKAVARKSRRANSTEIRAARPSDESEVATYSAFGTGFGTAYVANDFEVHSAMVSERGTTVNANWAYNQPFGRYRPVGVIRDRQL